MNILALLLILQQDVEHAVTRTADGLDPFAVTFMLVSMGAVTALMVWCFARILRGRSHFDPDGTGPAKPPIPGRVERKGKTDEL